jgi:hypothetical protein
LNVILDLNGIQCSCIHKSTVTRRATQQKNFYLEDVVHSATVPTCVGPKAISVHVGLAIFLKKLSKFANITIWSSMVKSTTKQVVDYLFQNNVQPVNLNGQESCENI